MTYTANLEVDHKALRAQVFNEGWRIMKNRFYDAKMHGADWAAAKKIYEPLLDYLVDEEELHTVMMMMIGQLNASHTGVSGGPADDRAHGADALSRVRSSSADASGFYKVGHIYKDGPADHDYLKIKEGHYHRRGRRPRSEDDRQLLAVLHARGRHEVPLHGQRQAGEGRRVGGHDHAGRPAPPSAICSTRGGSTIAATWSTKLSNGEIGYLHIRAMDAPSLRQFQLDLAANRTKKALVIDQRFNGGGGIDQELLGILAGTAVPVHRRPRRRLPAAAAAELLRADGRDAERALGVGRGDVPGRLQGARARQGGRRADDGRGHRNRVVHAARWLDDPDAGQRRVDRRPGENMENYGVPPDVHVDNTPADFLQHRDAQIEKAVEVLKS